jgi:hypothetical protein
MAAAMTIMMIVAKGNDVIAKDIAFFLLTMLMRILFPC